MLFDTDFGFGLSGDYTSNTLAFATDAGQTGWPNPYWTTYLLRKLLENDSFRTDFINRYADLLNTAFKPARVVGVIDDMQAGIASEMAEHIRRWGSPGSVGDWQNNINWMRTFANERPAYARSHLRSQFSLGVDRQLTLNVSGPEQGYIRVNATDIKASTPGVNPVPYPWSGLYFQGVPVKVAAVAQPGYRFSHWAGPEGIDPFSQTLTLSLTGDVSLTANFEEKPAPELVHYWHFNNLPSGTISSVPADYSVLGDAVITYPGSGSGYMDRISDGTALNAALGAAPGYALRVRNPSDTREMFLTIPTTGYEDICLSYAVKRTTNGAQEQSVFYRTAAPGGWTQLGQTVIITENYELLSFDFSDIDASDNNPDFAVKILFGGSNASGTEGNNRFDNIAAWASPIRFLGSLNDFIAWWLTTDCQQHNYCDYADLNRDGRMDIEDFAIFATKWLDEN